MEHCPLPCHCSSLTPLLSALPPPARGSAIAKIVGGNAAQLAHFDPRVTMWVFEEDIGGRKLTEIINTEHENVKYLPGHKLPPNVVSPNTPGIGRGKWRGPFHAPLDLRSISGGLLQAQGILVHSSQGTSWD